MSRIGKMPVTVPQGVDVSIKQDQISAFAGFNGSDGSQVHSFRGVAGVCVEHGFTWHGLGGIENAFFALAGFGLVDRAENICGGDGPVAGAGDYSAIVQN